MKRILFVDDEARVLSGLRRQLFARRGEWDMEFVESGPAALESLARQPADVLVSDMRMPGMDGAQLLGCVARKHPRVVRLVLSGHADPDRVQVARSCAHQYLHKPCPPDTLQAEIVRALGVRATLDRLAWQEAEQVWSTPPGNAGGAGGAFMALVEGADGVAVAAAVEAQLAADPALAGRVGLLLPGADGARRAPLPLILAVRFFDAFLAGGGTPRWRRATALAARVAAIASAEKSAADVGAQAATAATLAGLLESRPGDAGAAREVLEYLLPTWGFAEPVVTALAWLDEPSGCPAPLSQPLALLAGAELLLGWADQAQAVGPEREARLEAFLKDRGLAAPRQRWPAAAALPV